MRLRMLLRIALAALDVLRRPRAYHRLAPAILVILALSGCATTKPLSVACVSCSLLQATGLCTEAMATAAKRPACPEGQRWEILNYQRWLDGEEAPRVECRSYSIQ